MVNLFFLFKTYMKYLSLYANFLDWYFYSSLILMSLNKLLPVLYLITISYIITPDLALKCILNT